MKGLGWGVAVAAVVTFLVLRPRRPVGQVARPAGGVGSASSGAELGAALGVMVDGAIKLFSAPVEPEPELLNTYGR